VNLRRWLPPLLWAVVILVITTVPVPAVGAPEGTDKGIHGLLYLVLGFLAGRSLLAARTVPVWQLLALVVGLAAFGAVDEAHQMMLSERTPDIRDWIADVLGSLAGVAFALVRTARGARALS
jgi:VanZ family protein